MAKDRSGRTRRSVLEKGVIATGALVIGGTAVSGTAAAGIGDGRVAHYHLNNIRYRRHRGDIVAERVRDASPEKNHGLNHDAEVVKDGAVGNAFEFDGDDYIAVGNDPSLVFGDGTSDDPFSVGAWVYIPEKRNAHVVGKGNTTDSLEYLLNVDTDREWAQFRMYDGGGGNTILRRVAFEDNVGEWHHVAGTYDGSGDESGITVYVDGAEGTTVRTKDTSYTAMDNRGDDVEVGAVLRGDDRFGGFFKGRLDEVRIYNRVLTDGEVQELADMGDG